MERKSVEEGKEKEKRKRGEEGEIFQGEKEEGGEEDGYIDKWEGAARTKFQTGRQIKTKRKACEYMRLCGCTCVCVYFWSWKGLHISNINGRSNKESEVEASREEGPMGVHGMASE